MARREPAIISKAAEKHLVHIQQLAEILQMTAEETLSAAALHPGLFVQPTAHVAERLVLLCQALGASRQQVAFAAVKVPAILNLNSELIVRRMSFLSDLLAADLPTVVHMLLQRPDLLLYRPERLRASLRSCHEVLNDLEPGIVIRMVLHRPELIADSSHSVMQSKWRMLQALCADSPTWQQELCQATPEQLADIVLAGYRALARLRYLASRKLQGELGMQSALATSDAAFRSKFRDYEQWLK